MSFQFQSTNDLYGFPQPISRVFPGPVIAKRAPTTSDYKYNIGQIWIDEVGEDGYILVNVASNVATWNVIAITPGNVDTLTGDSGGAITPSAGNINVLGTANQITTVGSGSTITWSLPSAVTMPGSLSVTTTLGVTGLSTLAALTQVGTANINQTGTAATNLGGSSGLLTITSGSGGLTAVGGGNTIQLFNDAAANTITLGSTTASASLALQSGSGGNTTIAGNAAATITIGASAQTGKISIADSTEAMPAVDLMNGVATGAQVLNIASGTSATGAQTVNLLSGATPGASTTLNIMGGAGTAGTQAFNLLSSGATRAGTYNIGDGAAAHVGVIGSTTASASLTLQAGSGTTGLSLSAGGNVQMAPVTGSSASSPITITGRVVQATFTGFTTASGSSDVFELTDSAITGTTQAIIVTADNLGSNDAQMTITRVLQAASSLKVTLKNNGAAALNGDVHITAWILN